MLPPPPPTVPEELPLLWTERPTVSILFLAFDCMLYLISQVCVVLCPLGSWIRHRVGWELQRYPSNAPALLGNLLKHEIGH